ncbi:MAG TPA: pyruvate dehydrogenase (acetyl-transferring), homodimeric type [Solirubrobacteraceae bacterium]|jgi:pyruvate dehydrogenase E1 component|nr:pyruvate dehydrogenase (acetyl-transferring), homodimeric type [Solirubrobacteraceae bacterium]
MTETINGTSTNGADVDVVETTEWLDALDAVVEHDGVDRARHLLTRVVERAQHAGSGPIGTLNTPYVNTIPASLDEPIPGDPELERRLRSIIRWNAMAMVVRANKYSSELGGHIASYQSLATLYEVGFNHFWHAPSAEHGGDLVYFQGHSSPGNYARAYLEGRLSEEQLDNFRQEVGGNGLSSYPHPWLMPDFWQFPTVSLGIGAITSIYQARFMKYLSHRALTDTTGRKVWAFLGDGEMDEPETMGAIGLAGREKLDNLIWVVNCNLQRLDGPVRGNGKIIQELESDFRGAGWNVVKVIWGSRWDALLDADIDGRLVRVMTESVDGEYQTYKSRDGQFVREHFFGKDPVLLDRVSHMSDDEIWQLNRGGLDQQKVYSAYANAVREIGRPTVILAKTIKGYGMGASGEGQMIAHQAKKMAEEALLAFRDRFELPLTDEQVRAAEYYKPPEDSPEMKLLSETRARLGGALPARRRKAGPVQVPELSAFQSQLDGTGEREISTTMAFVRVLATLLRDKQIGKRVVPIVPDESRTFGMEGMFRQVGVYSPFGQLYKPEDSEQLMYYREDQAGQILEEGITEAGSMSSFIAAGTSYSAHGEQTIPFYIYYSMFGYQRVGDLIWAAADSRARGFLLGGTAGRTTLNGEGLQHEDGHSHVLFSVVPNVRAYDPAYGHEVAVIIQEGLRRMVGEQEDVFYYLTLMNENYVHPPMPTGAEQGILRGMYLLRDAGSPRTKKPRVQLLGSGTILREVLAAAELLEQDFGVLADVWSVTSFTELRRDGIEVERWNTLNPLAKKARMPYVSELLEKRQGPVIASTDYIRAFADQIRAWVPGRYRVLGTDGFGRSDYRKALRSFFEVDRHHVVVSALKALADDGVIDAKQVAEAIKRYEIDSSAPMPTTV